MGPVPEMNKTIYKAGKEGARAVDKKIQNSQAMLVQLVHTLVPLINTAQPSDEQEQISNVSLFIL